MGYRCVMPKEKAGEGEFRLVEVVMVKKSANAESVVAKQVVIVDNHQDTLRHVQDHMDEFIDNILKVKKMEENDRRNVAEAAAIFKESLEPLFAMITASADKHVLGKLSHSLKKALILMAMERYDGDEEMVCKVLGISRERLAREMSNCGAPRPRKAA